MVENTPYHLPPEKVKEFVYKVAIPKLMEKFEIEPERLKFSLDDVIIDANAPTSYYDPSRKVIVLHPQMLDVSTIGEEVTHYLEHAVFGEIKDHIVSEFRGFIGRYALCDALNLKCELPRKVDHSKLEKEIDLAPDIPLLDHAPKILKMFIEKIVIQGKLYSLMLAYLVHPNEQIRQVIEKVFYSLEKYKREIEKRITTLRELEQKYADTKEKPGTLRSLILEWTKQQIETEREMLESLMQQLQELVEEPDVSKVKEEIKELYKDWIENLSGDQVNVFLHDLLEGCLMGYPKYAWRRVQEAIAKGDPKEIEKIKNCIKNELKIIKKIYNHLKGYSSFGRLDITIRDLAYYVATTHAFGYNPAIDIVRKIQEGKLTYADAFWRAEELLFQYRKSY